MNDPLLYEPAGSRVVTLSVVPTTSAPPPPELSPELPPPPPPAQPARTIAVAERPAVATSARRNGPENADLMSVYLFRRSFPVEGRARAVRSTARCCEGLRSSTTMG